MLDDILDLVVGHERSVNTLDTATTKHEQHVAHAKKLLGAHLTENGAAVDLGCDLERDPGREVGLDCARDHVDRRTLRRHDQVNAGSTCHLRKALDSSLDVFARDHHQVGHLVNDHDDIGHFLERQFLFLVDRLAGVAVKSVWTVRVKLSPFSRACLMRVL